MRKGTKTLLFGMHHFLFHPILVAVAWKMAYKRIPSFRESVCILVHDWGYFGRKSIDGEDGENHPEFGAWVARKLFGEWGYRLVTGHSQTYAEKMGVPISMLWFPDKLAASLPPTWVWVIVGRITGELEEYMSNPKYFGLPRNSAWARFKEYKKRMRSRLEKRQFHPIKEIEVEHD